MPQQHNTQEKSWDLHSCLKTLTKTNRKLLWTTILNKIIAGVSVKETDIEVGGK